MARTTLSKSKTKRNGRTVDPDAARRVVEEAFAYKRAHPSPLNNLTEAQIMARIKKTRYELFEARFAARSR